MQSDLKWRGSARLRLATAGRLPDETAPQLDDKRSVVVVVVDVEVVRAPRA
jgi:hypothetical protein